MNWDNIPAATWRRVCKETFVMQQYADQDWISYVRENAATMELWTLIRQSTGERNPW